MPRFRLKLTACCPKGLCLHEFDLDCSSYCRGSRRRVSRTARRPLREPYASGETPEAELAVDAARAAAIAQQRAASDESTTFVLYTEGHPAGMIGAYFDGTPARRAFVSELWVAHAVRHLRGGVLLVNTARAWLATRGAGEIYAWIADQNRSAIRFYEHVGFADTGERAPITRVPGAMKSLFVWREHA